MATGFRDRFIGLMGRRDLDHAFLLIPNCTSIHTCFMRGSIDVLFLDSRRRVLGVHTVPPWRILLSPRGTRDTLELPPGFAAAQRIKPGDVIECQPA